MVPFEKKNLNKEIDRGKLNMPVKICRKQNNHDKAAE